MQRKNKRQTGKKRNEACSHVWLYWYSLCTLLTCGMFSHVYDTAIACLARRMATVALTSMHLERVTGYIKRFDKHGNIHEK